MADTINEAYGLEENGHIPNINSIQLGSLVNWDGNMAYGSFMRTTRPSRPYFTQSRARVIHKPSFDDGIRNFISSYLTFRFTCVGTSDVSGSKYFKGDQYTPIKVKTPIE